MRRREMLTYGAALLGAGAARAQRPAGGVYGLRDAAREAWIYTLPLNEVANVRGRILGLGARANIFYPQRALAGPEARTVTTPNNDTVYATAFIDLAKGPVTLVQPDLGDRYASFALMDMWSDNFAVLGARTTGPEGGRFTLVGPDAAAAGALRSPTPWVWALARVVVNGPGDLDAARTVLGGYHVEGGAPGPQAAKGARRDGPWQDYFTAVSGLLAENPAPATDLGVLRRIGPLGLGVGFDPGRFTPAQQAEIAAGVADAIALVRNGGLGSDEKNGWLFQAADTGEFFQDYLGRARVALGGLAALPPEEAMYLTAMSPAGQRSFDGEGVYRLRFAADQLPPVNAFWSLTMYEATADGQFFLTANPIHRYAIGDRTPGLVRGADGSLSLWISRVDPGGARSAPAAPRPMEPRPPAFDTAAASPVISDIGA